MFHRVKSEAEKPQTQAAQPATKNEQVSSPADSAKADNTARSTQETAPAATSPKQPESNAAQTQSTSTPTPQTQQKEAPMSETPETQNPEQTTTKAVDIPSSAYGTQPASRAAYPGSSYSGYGAQAMGSAQSATSHSSEERRLVIGQGITMSGEIEHCDMLLVEGTIEAALKGAKLLEISETGTFYGTVEIDEAQIAGRFEGDITVNGRLTLSAGGVITGSISYKELQIEAGATIDGKLTPLKEGAGASNRAPAKKEKSAKEAAALAKAKEIKEQSQSASNEDGELFSAAAAE